MSQAQVFDPAPTVLPATTPQLYGDGALAISGATLVVGAPETSADEPGSAYVYLRTAAGWALQARLQASDGGSNDEFGASVALEGNTLVVGAPRHYRLGNAIGAVYVFVRSGTTWTQQAKLLPSQALPGVPDGFGAALALYENTLLVGAPQTLVRRSGEPDRPAMGAAYIFNRNSGGTWSETTVLQPNDPASETIFGAAVGLVDDVLVVGRPGRGAGVEPRAPTVYAFGRSGGIWTQRNVLRPNSELAGWGSQIAMTRMVLVIGGGRGGPGAGFLDVRRRFNFTEWNIDTLLRPAGLGSDTVFGRAFATDGAMIVSRSFRENSGGISDSALHVFAYRATRWDEVQRIANGSHDHFALAGQTFAATRLMEGGLGARQADVFERIAPPAGGSWATSDVGFVGATGSGVAEGPGITLKGAGADVAGTSDGFRYYYRGFPGDGEIVARVTSLDNIDAEAKAGVMLRESLADGSQGAFMYITAGGLSGFRARTTMWGPTSGPTDATGTLNGWVKLTRVGDRVTGFYSTDGTNWTERGSAVLTSSDTIFAGFAVTSHRVGTLATATFDNVRLTMNGTQNGLAAPSNLRAEAEGNAYRLYWTDNAGDETGFELQYSTDNVTYTVVSSALPPNLTSINGGGPSASTTYYYRVRALRGSEVSAFSNVVALTTPAWGGYWESRDIGWVSASGSGPIVGDTHEVRGAGDDIWGWADEFFYRYQEMKGDGVFVARLNEMTDTNGWAKAGIMFRESVAANSRHAFVCLTPAHGTVFQYRQVTGGESGSATPSGDSSRPRFLRLRRAGNNFTGEVSFDGMAWTAAGSIALDLPPTILVGLAVTSHADPTLCTARFDNIRITPVMTPGVEIAVPTELETNPLSESSLELIWNDNSGNETGFEIERAPSGSSAFARIATVAANTRRYVNNDLATTTTYRYRVRAVNTGGASNYSDIKEGTTAIGSYGNTAGTLTASAASATQVNLSWQTALNEPGAVWELGRSRDNVRFTNISLPVSDRSYSDVTVAAATTYYYRIRVRTQNNRVSSYSTATVATPPDSGSNPWVDTNVGDVGGGGNTIITGGVVTINGAGADIWNGADEFRFRYQAWTGNGELITRVTRLDNTHGWAKAGVMVRESLAAGSRHAFMCVSAAQGTAFQARATTGGDSTTTTPSGSSVLPCWLRIVRSNNVIAGYISNDGVSWTPVSQLPGSWPATLYIGLAVTSHDDSRTTRADFENVVLRPVGPSSETPAAPSQLAISALSSTQMRLTWADNSPNETAFEIHRAFDIETFRLLTTVSANTTTFVDSDVRPNTYYQYNVRAINAAGSSPMSNIANGTTPPDTSTPAWSRGNIGGVATTGSDAYESASGTYTVRGSGADIWDRSDEFYFVHQRRDGDQTFIARITSVQNTHAWAKAGIMFRESLEPGARYVMAFLNPNDDAGLQARATAGGDSTSTMAPGSYIPMWLKLVRTGSRFEAFQSSNGTTWFSFASATLSLPTSLYIGLAVTSHNDGVVCTATFDNVSIGAATTSPDLPPATPTGLTAFAAASNRVDLSWVDHATDESDYVVDRSTDNAVFSPAGVVVANGTSFSDIAVSPSVTYYYRVRARKGSLNSANSNVATVTTPAANSSWASVDVGNVGLAGSTETAGNTITLRGSGADVWGRRDAARFVYRTLTGDGVVEARVTSMTNTHGWAKAGVMVREGLGDPSRNVFVCVTPAHGVVAQARTDGSGAGETESVAGPAAPAPYWVRISRSGNVFTSAASPDGQAWTTIATHTIAIAATAYYGFAVTSHDDAQLCTAVFADPSVR